jgi:hypothetical protein
MVLLNQKEYCLIYILVYNHGWKKKTFRDIASQLNNALILVCDVLA